MCWIKKEEEEEEEREESAGGVEAKDEDCEWGGRNIFVKKMQRHKSGGKGLHKGEMAKTCT